jgi:hypothetical protein
LMLLGLDAGSVNSIQGNDRDNSSSSALFVTMVTNRHMASNFFPNTANTTG